MLEADTPPLLLTDLPADVVQHIVVRLTLAHDIARAAPSCKVVSVAARNAFFVRPFSGEVVTLAGQVACVATAPDGRIITGWDVMKLWRNGACECTTQRHIHGVRAVAVLPDRFVSVSLGGTVNQWALDGSFERYFHVGGDVSCATAMPDGVHVAIGMPRHSGVRLYHVDGTLVHTFPHQARFVVTDGPPANENAVRALAVTPDGQHIIIGSEDNTVPVWSVASKSLVSTCRGHIDSVQSVAAMPDGQRILSGGGYEDHTVRVWLLDGTLKNTFSELHPSRGWVNALVALPDNQHALSGGSAVVKLFNVNDGAVLRTFTQHTHQVSCLALLPDGLRFVSGSWDGTARIVEHGLAPAR